MKVFSLFFVILFLVGETQGGQNDREMPTLPSHAESHRFLIRVWCLRVFFSVTSLKSITK